MEANYQNRRRINLSTSVKGVVTYDITIENMNDDNEKAVADVMDLKKRVEKELGVQNVSS